MRLIIITLSLFVATCAFANSKKADPRLEMLDARFAKFKKEFMKSCDAQVKANKDLKNTSAYCGCMTEKHHDFIVDKIKSNEKINVPKYLDDVLKLYKGQGTKAGEDSIAVIDLDAEMAEECLAN